MKEEKHILSIKDFCTICGLLNKEISELERRAGCVDGYENNSFYGKRISDAEFEKQKKEQWDELLLNPFYQDLKELNKNIRNLVIEIETPKIKID